MDNEKNNEVLRYLDGLPLTGALWWFIENHNSLASATETSAFYALRERVKNEHKTAANLSDRG